MLTSPYVIHISRRFLVLSAIGMACVVSAGCSGGASDAPALYPVTGTVTFDGEPVESGRIQFRADEGTGTAYSAEIKDGKYELATVPGKMTVAITASREVPGKVGEAASPDEEPQPVKEMYIPATYNTETTLTAEVTAGDNTIPFKLEAE